jgi:hypothetical protein
MPRRNSHSDNWEFGGASPREETQTPEPKSRMRRTATTLAFTALFFSGAALTAVAGDKFSHMSAEDAAVEETTTTDAAPPEAAPASDPAAAPAPAPAAEAAPPEPTPAPADDSSASNADDVPEPAAPAPAPDASSDAAAPESAPTDEAAPTANGSAAAGSPAKPAKGRAAKAHLSKVVLLPALKPATGAEIEGPASGATVWLNALLPDPTPPATRLSPAFARQLTATSKGTGLDWAFLLGILRAKGATGKRPADSVTLAKLGNRLADMKQSRGSSWATALAYGGSTGFADQATAFARYNRAVGLHALVHGVEGDKARLGAKLLAEPQISIYEGGRQDIVKGRVDVRVLAVIGYLHEAYGQVAVSCLISGHRLYARPGHISAHIYGRAVDIAALGGESILGNSAPGGMTEHAVRDLLLLPPEVMPQQIISLLGLGGPSFPLANHADHIHVGF